MSAQTVNVHGNFNVTIASPPHREVRVGSPLRCYVEDSHQQAHVWCNGKVGKENDGAICVVMDTDGHMARYEKVLSERMGRCQILDTVHRPSEAAVAAHMASQVAVDDRLYATSMKNATRVKRAKKHTAALEKLLNSTKEDLKHAQVAEVMAKCEARAYEDLLESDELVNECNAINKRLQAENDTLRREYMALKDKATKRVVGLEDSHLEIGDKYNTLLQSYNSVCAQLKNDEVTTLTAYEPILPLPVGKNGVKTTRDAAVYASWEN